MTVVEAMSAGAVPVVYGAGGHNEIVQDGINGSVWNNTDELLSKTINLINDKKTYNILSEKAKTASKNFGYEKFRESIAKIL
jgi:glycosyltransferase involved in cell wall biosynthesis